MAEQERPDMEMADAQALYRQLEAAGVLAIVASDLCQRVAPKLIEAEFIPAEASDFVRALARETANMADLYRRWMARDETLDPMDGFVSANSSMASALLLAHSISSGVGDDFANGNGEEHATYAASFLRAYDELISRVRPIVIKLEAVQEDDDDGSRR